MARITTTLSARNNAKKAAEKNSCSFILFSVNGKKSNEALQVIDRVCVAVELCSRMRSSHVCKCCSQGFGQQPTNRRSFLRSFVRCVLIVELGLGGRTDWAQLLYNFLIKPYFAVDVYHHHHQQQQLRQLPISMF